MPNLLTGTVTLKFILSNLYLMIKVGCCGFPKKRNEYFNTLPLVEIQQTFYKPMQDKTAVKMRERAGEEFEFSVKAWQLITHPPSSPTYRKAGIEVRDEKNYGFFRPTNEVFEAWEITKRIAEILKAKVVIFQTPKSFKECKENAENIRTFFSSLDRRFKYAWEARGWSDEGVKELCNELNLIHCVDPFANSTSTEGIAYFRLHGSQGKRMYRYRYTENDFEFLRDACRKFEEAYALFNNIYMWEDAVRFKEFVRTRAC